MAKKGQVTLTFAGDSKQLEKTFDKVGNGAKDMGRDFDKAADRSKDFGRKIDDAADKVSKSESTFIGSADILEGLSEAFGLPTAAAVPFIRAAGDIQGGLEQLQHVMKGGVSGLKTLATNFTSNAKAAATTSVANVRAAATTVAHTAATAAQTVATGAATVAQRALNVAMRANPVLLVVTAIAALAAGLVLAWRNSETFRRIVRGAFDVVADAARTVWGWINRVVDAGRAVADWGGWKIIGRIVSAPFTFIKDKVIGPMVGAIQGVITKFQQVIDWARNAIDAVKDFLGIGGPGITSLPAAQQARIRARIPQRRAAGGLVTAPEVALIGEAGPEAVIPLSRPSRARAVMSQAGLGGNSYSIVVQALDPRSAADAVVQAITAYERANGRTFARA